MLEKTSYFITGIDTGIGKTKCSLAIMHYFKRKGYSVIGMKPVATGCQYIDKQLKNDDALLLQKNASLFIPYASVNPYAFKSPVSPNIAAIQTGKTINLLVIKQRLTKLQVYANIVIVEGVGGWMTPLNATENVSDLAMILQLPVILIVGIRLGCINHALLTQTAIMASGLQFAGWIANCISEEILAKDLIINTLNTRIKAPLLAEIAYAETVEFSSLL